MAALVAAVFLVLLLMAVDAVAGWGRVHAGVRIAGYDFGGMKRGHAVERLASLVEASQAASITLVGGGKEWPAQPTLFGTQIDVEGTVAAAMDLTRDHGFFKNVLTRFSLYFSKREVELRGSVNQESMEAFIAGVAEELDNPPVNAQLAFDGSLVQVEEGRSGMIVDRPALSATLTSLLLSLHATEVSVPMIEARPEVEAAETAQAVAEAQVMISAPVFLTSGDRQWKLTGAEVQNLIDCLVEGKGDEARLVPVISTAKAEEFFNGVASQVNREVFDATWETDGQTATLLEAESGIELNVAGTALALTQAAKKLTERTAEAVLREVEPKRTTEQAQEMGVVSAVGKFMTEFEGSENRIANIQRAAQLINGTLLAPGEEFSFNKVVGERTAERGFAVAKVVSSDGTLSDDLGGGICQVATTLYNAAFLGGLEITERRNHSLYFSSYPKGRDATVSWDGPDLRFINDTEHWLLIRSAATNTTLIFVLYGTPDGRTVAYTTSDWYELEPQGTKTEATEELEVGQARVKDAGQDGRSCSVTRVVKAADGSVLHEDVFESRYPMYFKIIEEGTKTT